MHLYLIRHGQTPANVAGELDTAYPGSHLTALGGRQAEALVEALADVELVGLAVSPLVRTQLTAAPLAAARGLHAEVQHGLEEISAGELEMRADEEAVTSYLDAVAAWLHGDLDHTMPGGPDGHAFLARYDAAVRAVCEPHPARATVALVSHGAAIRTYTGLRASGPTATEVSERRIGNTGAVVLEGGPDRGWRVVRWSSEPLGGAGLADTAAHDVTGEAAEEAVADAADTAAHLGRR